MSLLQYAYSLLCSCKECILSSIGCLKQRTQHRENNVKSVLLVFSESGYSLERVLSSKNHFVASQMGRSHLGAMMDRNRLSQTWGEL